jgi:hypothetical protein
VDITLPLLRTMPLTVHFSIPFYSTLYAYSYPCSINYLHTPTVYWYQ